MNRVAVLAFKTGVTIIAFVLMDNHFHFAVYGKDYEQVLRFVNEFKRLTGQHNSQKYGERNALRKLPVKIIPVETVEYLQTLICYIIKNPTKARIAMFFDYPWGSGKLLFRQSAITDGIKIGSLGSKERRKHLSTHTNLPENWIIVDGVIDPSNYIPVERIENLFKTVRSYMFYLSLNKDDELEREMDSRSEANMTDTELRAARNELITSLFGDVSLHKLSVPERLHLAKQIRWNYYCSRKQIARIVQLPFDTVASAL